MTARLSGIIPAAVTPFTEAGDLDEAANRQQIRCLIESGVHGVVVGGSTGEGHTLTTDELRRAVSSALEGRQRPCQQGERRSCKVRAMRLKM